MGKKKNKRSTEEVVNNDVEDKKEEENCDNNQKTEDGGGKDGGGGGGAKNAVVLKVDLHCEGCASKIIKNIRAFEGVVNVEVDGASNKLSVTGKVDPIKLRDTLQKKLKKKVELLSPVPKKAKEGGGDNAGKGEKNKDSKDNNKNKSDGKNAKEPPVTTAVMKVPLHCEGCIQKIIKFITKTKGYHEMKFDRQKDFVTVTGAMDMKVLAESLKKYLKRDVEIVPPKKEKEKEKEKGKDNVGGGGSGGSGGVDGQAWVNIWNKMQVQVGQGNPMTYGSGAMPGYMDDPYQFNHQAPQMFSDENPNACSIM